MAEHFEPSETAIKMPDSVDGVWRWLRRMPGEYHRVRVVVEKVGGFVGGGPPCPLCHQPKNRSPGSAMFNFGMGYGSILGMLTAMDVPFEEVTPQRWQGAFGVEPMGKGGDQAEHKRRLKELAQSLFPSLKVTLATADALLLAEFARRQAEGWPEGTGAKKVKRVGRGLR